MRLSQQDRAYLARRFAEANREWNVGDQCLGIKAEYGKVTTVARIEGDIIHLANGQSMHRSHMKAAPAAPADRIF